MTTRRKVREYWTEVKRVVDGEVKQTTCCCASPGSTSKECRKVSGNKTACRCDCHRKYFPMPVDESKLTSLESDFYQLWKRLSKCKEPIEHDYRFHDVRKWRFDFAFPEKMVAVEMEGGVFSQGRHTRSSGYIGDVDKYNEAQALGWRVMRYTVKHLQSNPMGVIEQVKGLLSAS
jgi:very-short-patch-repair endonuclease